MSRHPSKTATHKWAIGRLSMAVVGVALMAGCTAPANDGGTDSASTAPPSASPSNTVPATQETGDTPSASTHAIGETVTMGTLDHTLHGVRFASGDEYTTPEPGTRWLVADIEVKNNADEPVAISSIGMWTLYDPDNRSVNQTITGDEQGSLDSELGPGRSLRGEIAFAVDAKHTKWELIFSPELLEFGQAIYEIPAPEAPADIPSPTQPPTEDTPVPDAGAQEMFTYEEALAALEGGMPYYDAFCINYEPTTDGGRSQCEGIEAGTVDSVTGEYIGG